MIFIDEEGDLMSRPVEKQVAFQGFEGGAAKNENPKSPAVPAGKAM
jgi:hypothetical protein